MWRAVLMIVKNDEIWWKMVLMMMTSSSDSNYCAIIIKLKTDINEEHVKSIVKWYGVLLIDEKLLFIND